MSKIYASEELKEVLDRHVLWLAGHKQGARADLAGANLARANLEGANLEGANLAKADLVGANLEGANLAKADLAEADLAKADLARAYLAGANLAGANLARANLEGANLEGANLAKAYLEGANLARANLEGANLAGAYLPPISIVPETGSFIAWRKVRCLNNQDNRILQLEIPADAGRVNSTGRKCRASQVKVLAAFCLNGDPAPENEFSSLQSAEFRYRVGESVVPNSDFNPDFRLECASGIHFFITRKEAVDYIY